MPALAPGTPVRITPACFVARWVGLRGRVVGSSGGEVVVEAGGVRYVLCRGSVERERVRTYEEECHERSEAHAAAVAGGW